MTRPENISPTAHATGHMWYRLGLSHPGLTSWRGQLLDGGFSLFTQAASSLTGGSFDTLMLIRHLGIDGQLEQAIQDGKVTQVIELAAGMSPRGWRFKRRYGDAIRYIESDLPGMVEAKRIQLQNAGLQAEGPEQMPINVLQAEGEGSLAAAVEQLDPNAGLAIITEGLMNYLDPEQAQTVWRHIAQALSRFPAGVYLSDAYLQQENRGVALGLFAGLLQSFVRGRIHIHFDSDKQAQDKLQDCGFASAQLHGAADLPSTRTLASQGMAQRVRVLEAWT